MDIDLHGSLMMNVVVELDHHETFRCKSPISALPIIAGQGRSDGALSFHAFWKVFNLVQEANWRRSDCAVWQAAIAPRRAVGAAGVELSMSNGCREENEKTMERAAAASGCQMSPAVRAGGP